MIILLAMTSIDLLAALALATANDFGPKQENKGHSAGEEAEVFASAIQIEKRETTIFDSIAACHKWRIIMLYLARMSRRG